MDMSMEDYSDDMIAHPRHNDNEIETDEEENMSMEMTQSYGGGIIHQQQQHQQEEDESFMTETSTRSDGETMEFTVAVGGFLPPVAPTSATRGRASLGYTHLDPTGSAALVPGEGEDEDDMEMDETVAFGGIINNHNGIGGDDTISTNASDDTINGVQGRERTMTFNFGDINTAARQEQSDMGVDVDVDVDVEFDMDMTTVGGGIHTQQHSHLHAHATIHTRPQQSQNIFAQSTNQNQPRPSSQQNIFAQSQSQSHTPQSPHRQTLTKPSSSTPSFARPTASSAQKSVSLPLSNSTSRSPEKQKEKRNIYGPSPSPAKSLATTPRKSGMGIAGEVAKRLSFGSVTSGSSVHGSVKRSRTVEQEGEEEEEEEMVKRQKSLGDSIFGRPRLSAPLAEPLAHGSTPRKSLAPDTSRGTPRKSMVLQSPARPTPKKSIGKSPRESMIPLITLPELEPELETENEVNVEDEQVELELGEEEEEMEMEMEPVEAPPIGLASFLQMAGVEFEDTLPILSRRKSGLRIEGSRGGFLITILFLVFLLHPIFLFALRSSVPFRRTLRPERRNDNDGVDGHKG